MAARLPAPGLLKIEYIIYMADDKIAVGGGGQGSESCIDLIGKTILRELLVKSLAR